MLLQCLHADGLAHDDVSLEMDTHLSQIFYLHINNLVGQAELGNTVLQYTANFVQCLKDINIVPFLHHVAGKR